MREAAGRTVGMRLVRTGGAEPEPIHRPRTTTVAVVSGKGGVGKTTLITNLALAIQRLGRNVLLVDGDWGMANVDLYLGLQVRHTLHDVLAGERTVREIVLETEDGLHVMPGASGVVEMENLDDLRCERLLCSIAEVEEGIDLILLDTSSGINRTTTHLARAADELLIVTTPEPAALMDAYASLKVLDRFRLPGRPWIVVNQARNGAEALEVAERIRSVAREHLGLELAYLGYVLEDAAVSSAVRRQAPLLKLFPHAPGTACIHRLAARLVSSSGPEPVGAADPHRLRRVANMEDAPA